MKIAISEFSLTYDVIWMGTFKTHARNNKAKVIFTGVGLGSKEEGLKPPNLNEEYLLQYDGLQMLDVELN